MGDAQLACGLSAVLVAAALEVARRAQQIGRSLALRAWPRRLADHRRRRAALPARRPPLERERAQRQRADTMCVAWAHGPSRGISATAAPSSRSWPEIIV